MSDKVEEELKKIIMKSISDNAEKQHQEQIEEVNEKGLWEADLKSWSFDELTEFITEGLVSYIKDREKQLQEENERLKKRLSSYAKISKVLEDSVIKKIDEQIDDLKQENERLKKDKQVLVEALENLIAVLPYKPEIAVYEMMKNATEALSVVKGN